MTSDSDIDVELKRLEALSACRHGLPAYYASLCEANDATLRVAAVAALLELGALRPAQYPLALELSCHNAVRTRAFKLLMARFEYDLARQVMQTDAPRVHDLGSQRMRAELDRDLTRCLDLDREIFLATGLVEHLHDARATSELIGGWRAAIKWAVLTVLVQPADPRGAYMLLNHLLEANQIDRVDTVCQGFARAGVYPLECSIFGAFVATARGEPKRAIKLLEPVLSREIGNNLRSTALRARASAFEALGQFRPAYNSFAQMNEVGLAPNAARVDIAKHYLDRAAYHIGDLEPDDRRSSHFMMVGFPRSGTTLLENALAAHPQIETFEEVPSFSRAVSFIDQHVKPGHPIPQSVSLEARRRYYEELDRRRTKTGARLFVDKLPLNTAAIKFLESLLPGKRYVFSIRHPFDVVLSCFKQHFGRNLAMDNFRRFADACRLYDFAMTQWFDVFGLQESERVAYVRYEELVNDFETTVTRVLRFVGADWSDEVLHFAEQADRRSARTPSYQKVRSGLTIGVQSSWQNYAFLFEGKDAAPLQRWVSHFGYSK